MSPSGATRASSLDQLGADLRGEAVVVQQPVVDLVEDRLADLRDGRGRRWSPARRRTSRATCCPSGRRPGCPRPGPRPPAAGRSSRRGSYWRSCSRIGIDSRNGDLGDDPAVLGLDAGNSTRCRDRRWPSQGSGFGVRGSDLSRHALARSDPRSSGSAAQMPAAAWQRVPTDQLAGELTGRSECRAERPELFRGCCTVPLGCQRGQSHTADYSGRSAAHRKAPAPLVTGRRGLHNTRPDCRHSHRPLAHYGTAMARSAARDPLRLCRRGRQPEDGRAAVRRLCRPGPAVLQHPLHRRGRRHQERDEAHAGRRSRRSATSRTSTG